MITVQDPGYSWGMWIGFGVVLLVWTLAFVIPAIVKRGLSEDTWLAFWTVLFVIAPVGTVVSGSRATISPRRRQTAVILRVTFDRGAT